MKKTFLVASAVLTLSAVAGNSCGDINLRLRGRIGDALDRMIAGHLAGTDIGYVTAPFKTHNERENLWRTEFWGKFMHAAEPFARYSGNPELRKIIDRGVADILAAQDASGYIGNYPDEKRFAAGGGWDLWGMKYTLMGLIHNYDGTGSKPSLDAAKKLLDYVIAEIGPNGKRKLSIASVGYCAGQPSLSILEPVMWLYDRTKEKRFLDFADYVVREMDDPKVGPQLITLGDCPVWRRNDPKSEKLVWNGACNRLKAYEMMSCYQGLLEYYEVTGRTDCLEAARKTAESIVADEINLAGGSCSSEHWFHGAVKQHLQYVHLQETCVTITWMRLLEKLSRLTDDPKWADEMERTFFNAYLGALKPDGTEFAAYTPLNGYRSKGHQHCRMHTNCCNANGPRGFLSFLRAAVRVKDDGALVVDQYVSSVISAKLKDGRDFGFDLYAPYPWDHDLRLTARNAGKCKVRLRIPAWSRKTTVNLNGQNLPDVKPGYFEIDRDWQEGDAITMCFDMSVVAHVVDRHVAFTRGPILLARDSRYGEGDLGEVIREGFGDGSVVGGSLLSRSPSADIAMTVALPLRIGSHSENLEESRPTQVEFCDYASAGSEWRPGNPYRTWFPLEQYPWND